MIVILIYRKRNVQCYPEPNALNPCEDIMGSYWLRICVWFVVVLAIVGNLAVMIVVIFSGSEMTVSKFLMCNLAFADFCMGLYLLLIASMDLHSVGSYFNFAYDWQYGKSTHQCKQRSLLIKIKFFLYRYWLSSGWFLNSFCITFISFYISCCYCRKMVCNHICHTSD